MGLLHQPWTQRGHISHHKVSRQNQCGIKKPRVYSAVCKCGVSFQSVLKSLYIHPDAHTDMPLGPYIQYCNILKQKLQGLRYII